MELQLKCTLFKKQQPHFSRSGVREIDSLVSLYPISLLNILLDFLLISNRKEFFLHKS